MVVCTRDRCRSGVLPDHLREVFSERDRRTGRNERQVTNPILVGRVEAIHHVHDETPVLRHVSSERLGIVVIAGGSVHDGYIVERDHREVDLTPREWSEDTALDAVPQARAMETRTEVRVRAPSRIDVERRPVVEFNRSEVVPGSRCKPIGCSRIAQNHRLGKHIHRCQLSIGVGPVHLVANDEMRVEAFRESRGPATEAVLRDEHDRLVLPAFGGVQDRLVFVIANLDGHARDVTDRDATLGVPVDLAGDLIQERLVRDHDHGAELLLQGLDGESDEVERLAHTRGVREVPAMITVLRTEPDEQSLVRLTLVGVELDRQIVCREQALDAERERTTNRCVIAFLQYFCLSRGVDRFTEEPRRMPKLSCETISVARTSNMSKGQPNRIAENG